MGRQVIPLQAKVLQWLIALQRVIALKFILPLFERLHSVWHTVGLNGSCCSLTKWQITISVSVVLLLDIHTMVLVLIFYTTRHHTTTKTTSLTVQYSIILPLKSVVSLTFVNIEKRLLPYDVAKCCILLRNFLVVDINGALMLRVTYNHGIILPTKELCLFQYSTSLRRTSTGSRPSMMLQLNNSRPLVLGEKHDTATAEDITFTAGLLIIWLTLLSQSSLV